MKFNVNVEFNIDYLDEEGNLNKEMTETIKKKIVYEVLSKINQETISRLAKIAESEITNKVSVIFEEFMTKEVIITDTWGDIKKKYPSVLDMIKEKLNTFMSEKTYSSTNYEKIINTEGQKLIDNFIKNLSSTVMNGIRDQINEKAIKDISNKILSSPSLIEIIKKS